MSEVKKEEQVPVLTDAEQDYLDFVRKNQDRCRMWVKNKGNMQFPIVRREDGTFLWLNRKARRG